MPRQTQVVRSTDREVVNALLQLAEAFDFPGPVINIVGDDSFYNVSGNKEHIAKDEALKALLDLDGTVLEHFYLQAGSPTQNVLYLNRTPNQPFDLLTITWNNQNRPLPPEKFGMFVAMAKDKLREVKLNAGNSVLGASSFDALVNARAAELHELEGIAADIVKKTHERTLELEKAHADRRAALEAEFEALKREGQEDIDKFKAAAEVAVKQRTDALAAREAEVDKSEAKYARRQLRLDLLKILQGHADRFQLSWSTRRLRWPIGVLLTVALLGTGFLTYVAFVDLADELRSGAEWWRIAMVSAKQVFFAVTFLGLATYALRWLEGWSKRHADAEFYFKQLELDLNRASWVVEIAAEWREKEGKELPKELLAQLSSHLFEESGFAGEQQGGESLLASILGGATKLKLSTPGGGELEIGRSGIRKLVK